MQTAEVLKGQLRLDLVVSEGTPWPALRVSADAIVGDERRPLGNLAQAARVAANPFDALLVRTLLQQPQAGGVFVVGPREFAAVLALLRNPSLNCVVREEGRIAGLEILADAPSWELRASHFSFSPDQNSEAAMLDLRQT